MPGQKRKHMRELAEEADDKARRLEAEGSPDAPYARARAEVMKAKAAAAFAELPPGTTHLQLPPPRPSAAKAEVDRIRKAVRLVGTKAVPHGTPEGGRPLEAHAGALATEIAVAGVRPGFLIVPPTPAAPLTPEEYETARLIVASVTPDSEPASAAEDPERWLAETFPVLPPDTRVRCARFLSAMATLAAEAPCADAARGMTVAERALREAGMSFMAFETARSREIRFADAQAAVSSARERCLMNRLEEVLLQRAMEGQKEETLDRMGCPVQVQRYDNNLAFNLLKYRHEMYIKQNIKDKAAANAMTLMIAQGALPPADPVPQAPKMAEVIQQ